MSSHQNSAIHAESVFELMPQTSQRPAHPQSKVMARASHAPVEIWGQYNNYRANGVVVSAIVHACLVALLISGAFFGHEVVQRVAARQNITLIAPDPETYALPTSKKIVSGGGGGGDHDVLPAILVRNEHPRLAVEPTVVVPPQVHLADNHMPNIGVAASAVLPSAPPSNGTGSGGGIGSGSGGGVGVGHGPGVGAGSGGGIGGGSVCS